MADSLKQPVTRGFVGLQCFLQQSLIHVQFCVCNDARDLRLARYCASRCRSSNKLGFADNFEMIGSRSGDIQPRIP